METPAQVVHETLTVLGSLAQRKESSHLRRLLEHERADVETMVSEFTALLHASCAKSSVEEAFASQKFKGRTAAEWVDKDHWIQVSMVQIMSLIASLQKQRTAASQSLERIDAALQAATQSLPQAVNSSGETECGTTSEKLNSAPDHCSDCPNFDDIVSEEQLAARLVCSDFSDFYFPSVGMEHLHSVCNVEVPKVSLLSYLIATTNGLTTKVDNINYLIAERQQCARFLNGFNLSATAVTVTTEQLITEIQTLKSDKKIQHFLRKKVSEEEKKLFDAQTELLAAAMAADKAMLKLSQTTHQYTGMSLETPLMDRRWLLRKIWDLVSECERAALVISQNMAGDIHLKEHSCVGTAPDNSAFLDDVKAVVRRSLHMIFKIEESEREISVPKFFLKIQQATLGPKVQEHQQVMASIDSGIEGEAPPMVRNFKDVREQEQPMQFLQLSVADNSTAQDEVASLDSKYVFERFLPFHFADVSTVKQHWTFYVQEYYNKQLGRPTHARLSFFRYLGLNQHMTAERLSQLWASNPSQYEKLADLQLTRPGVFQQVQYLETAQEREQYRLRILHGRLVTDVNHSGKNVTQLFDTQWMQSDSSGRGFCIHVLWDDAQNPEGGSQLFAGNHVRGQFHHSSLVAGDPVLFAGEMRVIRGKLTTISDKSGHYKPQEKHALSQLLYLKRHGVRLQDVTMRWTTPTGFSEENAELALKRMVAANTTKADSARCEDLFHVNPFERFTTEWLAKYCPELLKSVEKDFVTKLSLQGLTFGKYHPCGGALILALDGQCSQADFVEAAGISEDQYNELRRGVSRWRADRRKRI